MATTSVAPTLRSGKAICFRATFSDRYSTASELTVYEFTRVDGTPSCALSASSTASGVVRPISTSTRPSRRRVRF